MCGPVNSHGLTMMARSVELIKINIIIIYNNYSVSDLFNIKHQETSDCAPGGTDVPNRLFMKGVGYK